MSFIAEPLLQVPEVLEGFRRSAEMLGVVRCIWFIPPPAHAVKHEQTLLFHWGFAPEWAQLYATLPHDVPKQVEAAISAAQPARWSDLIAERLGNPKGAAFRPMFERFVELHPEDGFVFPIFGPYSTASLISCAMLPAIANFSDARFVALSDVADTALRQIAFIKNQQYRDAMRLSPREQDVLRGLGAGLSKKEIARTMEIAPASVDTYARRIFFKLDVDDRVEAVVKAVSLGLVKL
jgi:LuxR family transcriptional regulator, quorum-sensing system regulator BjaR1